MRGGTFAIILACASVVVLPVTLRTFHLFQPVHLELIWWTVLTLLTVCYLRSEDRRYLLYLGIAVGLALLTKYLVLLFVGGLLVGFLGFRPTVFRERYLYLAGLLALTLVLPNLLWQAFHDWPVVGHLLALNENQLVHVGRLDILTDQLLMAFAGSILLVPGLFYLAYRHRVLAVAVVFTMAMLLILRGKSYYAMGLYPVLLAAGAVVWERYLPKGGWRWVLPVLIVGINLPLLPIGLPVLGEAGLINYFADLERDYDITPGRRWEDGKVHPLPQDYADQIGWPELKSQLVAA